MSSFGGARPKTTGSSRGLGGEEESEGNLEDDYVYTYTGGGDVLLADLPKSLYGIHLSEQPQVIVAPAASSSSSPVVAIPPPPVEQESPDMDFLEMDFDENVSESPSVSLHLEEEEDEEEDYHPPIREDHLPDPIVDAESDLRSSQPSSRLNQPEAASSLPPEEEEEELERRSSTPPPSNHVPSSPEHIPLLEKTMIWSEDEAKSKEALCEPNTPPGIVSLMNVLRALGHNPDRSDLLSGLKKHPHIDNDDDLPSFLFSLSKKDSPNYKDLIALGSKVSKGCVRGRFFPTYPLHPKSLPPLCPWLASWIRKGAVPLAAMNVESSWHYSMIYGVGPSGVYGTNPSLIAPEKFFTQYLNSPSVLFVDKCEVIRRWTVDTDLTPLRDTKDSRWVDLNVLGQVIHTLREEKSAGSGANAPEFIRIPSAHRCGIILFMNSEGKNLGEMCASEWGADEDSATSPPSTSKVR